MDNSNYIKNLCNSLSHSGIKGQKWGLRRFQNEDGTLTDLGKKRYLDDAGNLNAKGKEVLSNEKSLLILKVILLNLVSMHMDIKIKMI